MSNNNLTVVTVTRNDIQGLKATADSICIQGEQDFKWVVIDGASDDGTVEFLMEESRLNFMYKSEPDDGIYDAMKKGLDLCDSGYVLFLNSGDVLNDSDSINTIKKNLTDSVVFFGCVLTFGRLLKIRRPLHLSNAKYSVPAVQQATVYSVNELRLIDWPREYKICGDFAIAAQLLAKNASCKVVDAVISRFEIGGVSTTRPIALIKEANNVQKNILHLPLYYRIGCGIRRFISTMVVLFLYKIIR